VNDPDAVLMSMIHQKWGPEIAQACSVRGTWNVSAIPQAFLAALVANESGGNPDARRFEKGVLAALWEVLAGRSAAYGSIHRSELVAYVTVPPLSDPPAGGIPAAVTAALLRLDGLATSWGLTQIMGYEALAMNTPIANLKWPNASLLWTLRMLRDFEHRWKLPDGVDCEEMFRCWNTGRPHAPTADPNYVPRGLARMKIYAALLGDVPPPGGEPPKAISA
jgi:hypothetical protein